MARILIADDEEGIRLFLSEVLAEEGHEVTTAEDGAVALELLQARGFDLLLTDLSMPRMDGLELLRRAKDEQPELEVILLTAHGSVDSAVEAMRLGAFDYLQKPLSGPDELRLLAARALERRSLIASRERADRMSSSLPSLTHGAPSMEPVVEALRKVARTEATVLLEGESGTGKEVAARTLHDWSARRDGPFVAVNCAAISDSLLESELFGHEKGAFTGATSARRGRIELASGGTFFLDEVGELKPDLQAKLLRVLQERLFERVGGSRTLQADVRWVAATNRQLEDMLEEGSFREDLYHRLAVFPVTLPALRERREDLLPLAMVLLEEISVELGRPKLALAKDAEEHLLRGDWPGNVRELRNALEQAAILADGTTIEAANFLNRRRSRKAGPLDPGGLSLAELEREAIERALAESDGHRQKAAERLGIGLRTLYDKIKKYGL
ncbi:MAG: sigma-54 dependent transcriptional regulator [Acidobacteriota bacterium]